MEGEFSRRTIFLISIYLIKFRIRFSALSALKQARYLILVQGNSALSGFAITSTNAARKNPDCVTVRITYRPPKASLEQPSSSNRVPSTGLARARPQLSVLSCSLAHHDMKARIPWLCRTTNRFLIFHLQIWDDTNYCRK